MRGILKYYVPNPEENYPGAWGVSTGGDIFTRKSWRPSEKSQRWIDKNLEYKDFEMEVEFDVISECKFNKENLGGSHCFVADIYFEKKVKIGDSVKIDGVEFTIISEFTNSIGEDFVVCEGISQEIFVIKVSELH